MYIIYLIVIRDFLKQNCYLKALFTIYIYIIYFIFVIYKIILPSLSLLSNDKPWVKTFYVKATIKLHRDYGICIWAKTVF